MKYLKLYEDFLDRHAKQKVDLSKVEVAYHWLTEGKLFEACYGSKVDATPYCIKKGKMPELPKPVFNLTPGEFVCFTVDPTYMNPAFNEDGSCLVFDFKKLVKDNPIIEDLTDNGEAEFRVKEIKNWPDYLVRIDIGKKSYMTGQGWEDFRFRAIRDWLPAELQPKVKTFGTLKTLAKNRMSNVETNEGWFFHMNLDLTSNKPMDSKDEEKQKVKLSTRTLVEMACDMFTEMGEMQPRTRGIIEQMIDNSALGDVYAFQGDAEEVLTILAANVQGIVFGEDDPECYVRRKDDTSEEYVFDPRNKVRSWYKRNIATFKQMDEDREKMRSRMLGGAADPTPGFGGY